MTTTPKPTMAEIAAFKSAVAKLTPEEIAAFKLVMGYPPGEQFITTEQAEEMARLLADRNRLQDFKNYVHQRLDTLGIDEHQEAECRAGRRLDDLSSTITQLREELAATGQCESTWKGSRCTKPKGHDGFHSDEIEDTA